MKWLITGGCGFVGSNLANSLLEDGNEITIFDNLSRHGSIKNLEWLRGLYGSDWTFLKSDIRDEKAVSDFIKQFKPDVIAHLAGQVAMTTSIQNPRLDFEVNTLGSLNVLEAVRQYSPESIILYSSTNKVYGDLAWVRYEETDTRYTIPDFPHGFDETTPLTFHSPYGCSKGAADQYMQDYARMFDLKTVVFRHSSMYGGRQFATYDQGWIGWFCQKAVEEKTNKKNGRETKSFTISGNGKQVRDVLNSNDIIKIYIKAADKIQSLQGKVFNVGGGFDNSLSILELLNFLEQELDINLKYTKNLSRKSDQKVFIADNSNLFSLINFDPFITYDKGLSEMIEWVESINLADKDNKL
jgi:CDP-paratose 2-epimerase